MGSLFLDVVVLGDVCEGVLFYGGYGMEGR